ncbi:MAG TPA: hypothetical protein VMR70_12505, partial [Flavisolibacter sp.]|nr:hypothetical protein [Flavisolibacter sp.]
QGKKFIRLVVINGFALTHQVLLSPAILILGKEYIAVPSPAVWQNGKNKFSFHEIGQKTARQLYVPFPMLQP